MDEDQLNELNELLWDATYDGEGRIDAKLLNEHLEKHGLAIVSATRIEELTRRIAELEHSEAEYERIVGPKTYQEVADEIERLEANLRVRED